MYRGPSRRPVRYEDLPVWAPGLVIPPDQRGCGWDEWERGMLAEAKAAFLARERAAVVPPVEKKRKGAKRGKQQHGTTEGF